MTVTAMTVAVLHPGRMGAGVARAARTGGARVLWCPTGRGEATRQRADAAELEAVEHFGDLLAASDVVLSICPPAVAEDVAAQVADHGFSGLYVEANAISPQRLQHVAKTVTRGGAHVVDGCIIGPPPDEGASPRLYLAGSDGDTAAVASLFPGTRVRPVPMSADLGAASALKAAYASFQKASRALAGVSHALADAYGVGDALADEAERTAASALAEPDYLPSVAARAWRWAPELDQVAETLRAAGLPDELASAAAQVLQRWQDHKDDFDAALPDVLASLHNSDETDARS